MTIELDSTLAQAEVLFLSFAQLVADIDRRRSEGTSNIAGLRRRGAVGDGGAVEAEVKINMPVLSDNLRELLEAGR